MWNSWITAAQWICTHMYRSHCKTGEDTTLWEWIVQLSYQFKNDMTVSDVIIYLHYSVLRIPYLQHLHNLLQVHQTMQHTFHLVSKILKTILTKLTDCKQSLLLLWSLSSDTSPSASLLLPWRPRLPANIPQTFYRYTIIILNFITTIQWYSK